MQFRAWPEKHGADDAECRVKVHKGRSRGSAGHGSGELSVRRRAGTGDENRRCVGDVLQLSAVLSAHKTVFCKKRDPKTYRKMLDRLLAQTLQDKMHGERDDCGRLKEENEKRRGAKAPRLFD